MNTSVIHANDIRTRNAVEAELAWAPQIPDAASIGVAVHEGVVTLTGTVSSYSQRMAAALAALDTRGVTAVANDIEVVYGARHDDAAIAEQARDALLADVRVPDDAIDLQVTHGVVTMGGTVDWQFQRAAAYRAVETLPGVKGVLENIRLVPKLSASNAEDHIREALARRANLDADRVHVEIDGTTVTLRGEVSSHLEKEAAARAVWGSPHVAHVRNELRIAPPQAL